MIVVLIIGLLAAIAIPAFDRVRQASLNTRLINDLRVFGDQIEVFVMENGSYPEDSGTGNIPTGLAPYIHAAQWHAGPSIGGDFDVEKDSYGIVSAIGVHRYTVDDSQLQRFDAKYDDGSFTTGRYRKLDSDRYYMVIAE